ncbi:MAG: hypothetical protein V1806_01300 [Pseudomonadota bacterium]
MASKNQGDPAMLARPPSEGKRRERLTNRLPMPALTPEDNINTQASRLALTMMEFPL